MKWLMQLEKLVGKFASWALMLQKYDFQVVRCASLVNWNVGGLSLDPSTSQQNGTRGGWWHDNINEEMVLGWRAFAFLCIFVMEAYVTSLGKINMLAQTSWALKMCIKMHQYWICQPNLLMGEEGYVKFEAHSKKKWEQMKHRYDTPQILTILYYKKWCEFNKESNDVSMDMQTLRNYALKSKSIP